MTSIEKFIDNRLIYGRAYFSREEARAALDMNPYTLTVGFTRLIKKQRLANPRHGFFLILRPEDTVSGAPDPVRWIDPLMRHQALDYRISLLTVAAFHGSSHQAAMVFQIIVPKQQRDLVLGRHRIEFVYQAPETFARLNQPDWLVQIKSEAGFAQAAGIELTLLDCARYLRKTTGIQGVAQIAKDLGSHAQPRKLAKAAALYENSTVRRLGYLLELSGHVRQAKVLAPFAHHAKSSVPLDPSVTPLLVATIASYEKNTKWKLLINESVEIDF